MKIVFIQPRHFVHPDRAYEPLNLGYLAAYLRSKEYNDVSIRIGAYERDKDILSDAVTADVVGITATSPMIKHGKFLAQEIKKGNPDTKIVVGGTHPSALPDSTLKDEKFDIAVRGEGEITMYELVKAIEEGRSLEEIAGISYRIDGKIHHNPPRELIEDLDVLPYPARDLLMQEKFSKRFYRMFGVKSAWVYSSRGCPFQCAYCASHCVWTRKWRARSAENVIGEIKDLVENYGVGRIDFADDTFTVNKKRVLRFCELLRQENLGITWGCNVHVNTVDNEMLEAMRASGCDEIWMGVESGSPKILKEYAKGSTIEQVRKAFQAAKEVGIMSRAYLMIGAPSESKETIEETEKLLEEIQPDYVGFTILTPFPGCEFYDLAKKQEFLNDEIDWAKIDLDKATVPTKYLSRSELNSEHKRLTQKYVSQEKKKRFSLWYLFYRGWLEIKATPLREYPILITKFWNYLRRTM